ncbi:MAG TPA: hypothetical protein VEX87_04385 [Skermanella sp.]|jgi:hypothetical protein|nr:hypothetical protein [Skermanella sp.]
MSGDHRRSLGFQMSGSSSRSNQQAPASNPGPAESPTNPPSDFAAFWAKTFTEARDKAVQNLQSQDAPVYVVRDGKVVELKLDPRHDLKP